MLQVQLALIFVQVAYGGMHVIIKSSLSSPEKSLSFGAWSNFIALLVLAPFAYVYEKRLRPQFTKRCFTYFVLLGLTGIVGNQLLFMIGLNYTSPVIASSLQPSTPVLTFVLSILFGLESLNLRKLRGQIKLTGVFLCITGAFVIITLQNHAHPKPSLVKSESSRVALNIEQTSSIGRKLLINDGVEDVINIFGMVKINKWYFGIICLLGHCSSMATYLILQAVFLKSYPAPISVTAYSYFFGDIFFFLFGVFFITPSSWVLNTAETLAVLYASLIASALNYSLMTWTNKLVGPSMVALYTPLQPFTSSILSYIFLGSEISLGSVLGGICILTGLYFVTIVHNVGDYTITKSGSK